MLVTCRKWKRCSMVGADIVGWPPARLSTSGLCSVNQVACLESLTCSRVSSMEQHGPTHCALWTKQESPKHGSNTMKIGAMIYGDFHRVRRHEYSPRRSWTATPEDRNVFEIVDWGCGYGRDSLYFLELGFDVIGIDVSEKAVALARGAYKQRQASGIPLLAALVFMLAICTRFSSAEPDKECVPSSLIESSIC
jgi:hypothetical protein